MILQNRNIIWIGLGTLALLLIPLIAMQFTTEVNWDLFDFVFACVLIFGTGVAYELISKKLGSWTYKTAIAMALATASLLVWINGAVGIIGSENNDANLLYGAVIATLIIGSLIVRFRPVGMLYVLYLTALAQFLVPIVAFFIWNPEVISWGAAGVLGVFGLNAFFAVMFIGSALLFRQSAKKTT